VRARRSGLVHDVMTIAGRALRAVPRDVEVIIPPIFIALFFFLVNIGTLENLTENTIPGFAIIFLSLGLMERDGGLILCGYGLTLVAAIYVVLIGLAGTAGVDHLWRMLKGG